MQIDGMDNKYLQVKPTEGDNPRRGYGWSFLGSRSAHGGMTSCVGGWKRLQGAHLLDSGNHDNLILVTDDAESLWRTHSAKESFIGAWVLSSMGERSHGQNFKRVIELMKASRCAFIDVPIIGNGISRNSSLGFENRLHGKGTLQWRTVDPDGNRSRTYGAKEFYKPEVDKTLGTKAVEIAREVALAKANGTAPTTVVGKLASVIEMHRAGDP